MAAMGVKFGGCGRSRNRANAVIIVIKTKVLVGK
jgi:hypothetical protein